MMPKPTILIEPGRAERQYWHDLWRYRELFFVLAWRDVSVRYKQTVLGVAWAILQPLATVIVLTVVFGAVAKLPSEQGAPYSLLVIAGLLPWQLFSTALIGASGSVTANASLVTKVYFPRMIIPVAAIVVAFVDFCISFVILVALMIWYQCVPGWQILTLPIFVASALLTSLGAGLWITALNVKYRDFRYIIPFIVQFGLYISPVGFSSSALPEKWRLLYSFNPLVGTIDGFRWAILGGSTSSFLPSFIVSCFVVAIMLVLGIRQFRRLERSFADLM